MMGNCKFLSFLWNMFFCVPFVTSLLGADILLST